MEKLFNFRISAFKGMKVENIQRELAGLLVIGDCSDFDFECLLEPFRKKSGFRKSGSRVALNRLEDLYYLHSGWQPDGGGLSLLKFIMTMNGVLLKDSLSELVYYWHEIEDYFRETMPYKQLGDIIRSLSNDFDHDLRTVDYYDDFIERFIREITDSFNHDLRRYDKELRSKDRNKRIQKIFGDEALEDLKGFSREEEQIFFSESGVKPRYAEAFRVLKTFALRFIDPEIRPVLSKFKQAVNFIDEKIQNEFYEAFDTVCLIPIDVKSFEGVLEDRYPTTIKTWAEALVEKRLEGIGRKKVTLEMKFIDLRSDEIIQKCIFSFSEIIRIYKIITDDLRMNNGVVISNGRFLLQQETFLLQQTRDVITLIQSFINLANSYVISRKSMAEVVKITGKDQEHK